MMNPIRNQPRNVDPNFDSIWGVPLKTKRSTRHRYRAISLKMCC